MWLLVRRIFANKKKNKKWIRHVKSMLLLILQKTNTPQKEKHVNRCVFLFQKSMCIVIYHHDLSPQFLHLRPTLGIDAKSPNPLCAAFRPSS
jgi:hypothetical protein